VPLDISIKSNRKHHKTVLYSKSNKNMVGRLLGDFLLSLGNFFTKTSGHPASFRINMLSKYLSMTQRGVHKTSCNNHS
jgi:hypothetical protein